MQLPYRPERELLQINTDKKLPADSIFQQTRGRSTRLAATLNLELLGEPPRVRSQRSMNRKNPSPWIWPRAKRINAHALLHWREKRWRKKAFSDVSFRMVQYSQGWEQLRKGGGHVVQLDDVACRFYESGSDEIFLCLFQATGVWNESLASMR